MAKTTSRAPLRRLAPPLAAALALAPSGAAAASPRLLEDDPFLGLYSPSTDVGDLAALDVQQRTMSSLLPENLVAAHDVYEKGMGDLTAAAELTLKGLSTSMEKWAYKSPTFGHFVDYYGEPDYADQWAEAAFEGRDFYNFKAEDNPGKGNFLFSSFGDEGRNAAIEWGVPLLHIWISVVTYAEEAAVNCVASGTNTESITQWDKAAALYMGSDVKESGNGVHTNSGYFIYYLMQVECARFGTCNQQGERSPVNNKVFDRFNGGKAHLGDGNCDAVRQDAYEIKRLMTTVLVQGVIRSIHTMDVQDDTSEEVQGMGAAYAAAVLPLLSECNPSNALIVHNDLQPGKGAGGSYEVVRAALERSYKCLGVTCEEIGGLRNRLGNGFVDGAAPCTGTPSGSTVSSPNTGTSTGGGSSYNRLSTSGDYSSSGDYEENVGYEPINKPVPAYSENNNQDMVLIATLVGGIGGGFLVGLIVACLCSKKTPAKKEVQTADVVSANTFEQEEPKGADGEII